MQKTTKQGPGRPAIPDKEPTQDIHLRVPLKLLKAIDGVRDGKSRTALIIEAIELHQDVSLWIRYYGMDV